MKTETTVVWAPCNFPSKVPTGQRQPRIERKGDDLLRLKAIKECYGMVTDENVRFRCEQFAADFCSRPEDCFALYFDEEDETGDVWAKGTAC